MSFLDEIKSMAEMAVADVDGFAMKGFSTLESWMKAHPQPVFRLLREVEPILVLHNFAVVSRYDDVVEVLQRWDQFAVPYGPKMEALAGHFILGMDNSPEYDHDQSVLRLAIRREDLDHVRSLTGQIVDSILEGLAAKGTLDTVRDYADLIPARVIAEYLGVPGPDERTLIQWARSMFDEIFNNVTNDPAIATLARTSAAEFATYLDGLIASRKDAARGGGVPDDVLGRLLRMQQLPEWSFTDAQIRANLTGIIVGWIPTQSKALAMLMDELLRRPSSLAKAEEAARSGDQDLVSRYVFEALRFAPINPGVVRTCTSAYTLAKGTGRARTIPVGATVFAATQSAMLDGSVVDDPEAFRTDRPGSEYLHFGYGPHTCFGQHLNRALIPIMAAGLLKLPNLRRAGGSAGDLASAGNFPASMTVLFGE